MGMLTRSQDPAEQLRRRLDDAHEELHRELGRLVELGDALRARHDVLSADEDYERVAEAGDEIPGLRADLATHLEHPAYAVLARGSLAAALAELEARREKVFGHNAHITGISTERRRTDEGETVYYTRRLVHKGNGEAPDVETVEGLEPIPGPDGHLQRSQRASIDCDWDTSQLLLRYPRAQIAEELHDLQAISLLLQGESGLGHLRSMCEATRLLSSRVEDALETVEELLSTLAEERDVESRYERLDALGERMQRLGAGLV